MMKRLLILLLLTSPAVLAQTRYVDFVGGSDAFDGTAKTHTSGTVGPWKSSPYMQNAAGCSNNGGTHFGYTHTAGQQIIFKGGVTWPSACFPLNIAQGGSSVSVPDVYTVDQTWFSGGSFTRPIFAGQNATMPFNGSIAGQAMVAITASNVTMGTAGATNAGFDMGGQNIGTIPNSHCGSYVVAVAAGLNNVIVTQSILHDWIDTSSSQNANYNHSAGGMCYGTDANAAPGQNIVLDHSEVRDDGNVVGGTSTPWGVCGHDIVIQFSTCHYLFEGIVGFLSVHDSEFANLNYPHSADGLNSSGAHVNTIEEDVGLGDGPVYNNYIHDVKTYGEVIDASNAIYNNVLANFTNVGIRADCNGGTCTIFVANNTIDVTNGTNLGSQGVSCAANGNGTTTVQGGNNICIIGGVANGTVGNFGGTANNYSMSTSEQSTFGFIQANKYAPTSSDSNTVGKAANLTSSCSGSKAALCNDAAGAPWFGASYVQRPTGSTAWDMGAYQSGSGGPIVSAAITGTGCPSACSGTATITVTASGGTISSIQPLVDGNTFGNACTSSPCSVLWNTTKVGNGAHTVGGTATNGTGQGTATPVSVTVSNTTPGCTTSGATWTATSFTTQTGAFTATLTIMPNGVPPAGTGGPVVGLSQNPATAYADNSTLIRQSDNGFWEVFNGATGLYAHQASVSWIVGTAATITWSVDTVGQKASVTVTQSGVTSTLATGYAFRAAATSLSYWNLDPSSPPITLQVCNFTLGATGALTPASFNFGTFQVGNTASQVFTLTNNGGSPLTVSAYAVSPSVYTFTSNTCISPIAAGGNCLLTVQFAPSSPTSYPGTIHLTTTGTINDSTLSGAGSSISVPSVPLGLTAVVSGTTSALSWNASTGTAPITYNVSRGTISGGPYTSLATGLTVTNYSDSGLVNGTYYYVVSATNSAGTNANSSQVSATVSTSPMVNLSPASLAFGNVRLGASGSLNLTVANVGNANLVFNTPAISPISGPNAADFTFGAGCTDGSTVAAGSSCSFLVTFTPSATGTQEQGTLCTSSNSPTNPDCVTLTGSGVAAVTVLPASLSFGNIFIGKSSASQTVTFTNQSGATVTFSSIALTTGTNYAIGTNTCGGSVADGASCTVQLTFTPTAVGTLTDTLTFTDSAAGSPHTVALTGNGKTHHILKVGAVI